MSFGSLSDCVGDDVILKGIVEDFAHHLTALIDEFQRYFLRIVAENAQAALISNQFRCEVGTVESLPENSLSSTMTFLRRMNTILWSWRGFGFPFCIQN